MCKLTAQDVLKHFVLPSVGNVVKSTREVAGMDTPLKETPSRGLSPAWYGIGTVVLLMLMAMLFLMFSSASLWHELHDSPPPAGAVPGTLGLVVPH